MHYLPGKFILFDINHGVFDCFVHECVHTADEKVDGTQQCLSIFGQKLLGVSVVTKLLLKKRVKLIEVISLNFAPLFTVTKATAGASIIQFILEVYIQGL